MNPESLLSIRKKKFLNKAHKVYLFFFFFLFRQFQVFFFFFSIFFSTYFIFFSLFLFFTLVSCWPIAAKLITSWFKARVFLMPSKISSVFLPKVRLFLKFRVEITHSFLICVWFLVKTYFSPSFSQVATVISIPGEETKIPKTRSLFLIATKRPLTCRFLFALTFRVPK